MRRECPGCGEAYEYRIPKRFEQVFHVRDEYRCGPYDDGYIYVHKIPLEQGVTVPYNSNRRPLTDGGGRRCDYCLEYKYKTRVENLGSIICSDCDEEAGP